MERMFRKKIAVRVNPPTSSEDSPFFQVQIRIDPSSAPSLPDSPPSDLHYITDESLSVKMESLCWNLSRAYHVACLCFSLSLDFIVVYKKSQSASVDRVVKEICRRFQIGYIGVEQEVTSGSVVAQALECNLRCTFLDKNWTCLGNNLLVHSRFSTDDERSHLCAINANVHLDVDDGFTLLVSPDIVRFSRFKISDLLDSQMETKFYDGHEVILGDLNSSKYCHVLPSLFEGVQKGRFLTEDVDKSIELLSFKHGLTMVNDHFMRIRFGCGEYASEKWFPSAVVLQGSGLFPAPITARMMKTASVLSSFVKIVEGWNFFDQGLPAVKVMSSFEIDSESFTWSKAANAVTKCVSKDNTYPFLKETPSNDLSALTHLFSANDFRTPKPSHCIPEKIKLLQGDEPIYKKNEIARAVSINTLNQTLSSSLVKQGHNDFRAQEKIPQKEEASHGKSAAGVSNDKIKPQFQLRNLSKENISSGPTTFRGKNDNTSATSNRPNKNTITCPEHTQTEMTSDLAHKEKSNNNTSVTSNRPKKITITHPQPSQTETTSDRAHTETSIRGKVIEGKIKSAPQKKVKLPTEEIPEKGQSAAATQEPAYVVPAKRKMDKKEDSAKKKQCAPPNQSDISTKVTECHSKGSLGSLTVAELKSFLSLKKAKLSGKKEELIQRVVSLLA